MSNRIARPWPLAAVALTLVASRLVEQGSGVDLALHVDQNLITTLPRIATSIWSHNGWLHLAANLVGFAAFGLVAGRVWGALRIVTIFVAGGLTGGIAVLVTNTLGIAHSHGIRGASAAVLAIVTAVLTDRTKAGQFDLAWGSALAVLILSMVPVRGVSNEAHLGGALIGFVLGWTRPSHHVPAT